MRRALLALVVLLTCLSLPAPANAGQSGCELVELYPGYPSYRGLVAGLLGPGEVACLEDQQLLDPTFDRAAEDAANRAIAKEFGVVAAFVDWPWELWMLVGAERGYGYMCYSCTLISGYPAGARLESLNGPNDPRLLLNPVGEGFSFALSIELDDGSHPNMAMMASWMHDSWVRVLAFLASPQNLPTVQMIMRNAERVVKSYWCTPGPGCGASILTVCGVAERGGYVPSIPSLHPNDQLYILVAGMLASAYYLYGQISQMDTETRINTLVGQWQQHPEMSLVTLARQTFC